MSGFRWRLRHTLTIYLIVSSFDRRSPGRRENLLRSAARIADFNVPWDPGPLVTRGHSRSADFPRGLNLWRR